MKKMKKRYFRLNGITVAELEDLKSPGGYIYSISKAYKVNDEWQYTTYFTLRDLLVISNLIQHVAIKSSDIKEIDNDENKDD